MKGASGFLVWTPEALPLKAGWRNVALENPGVFSLFRLWLNPQGWGISR